MRRYLKVTSEMDSEEFEVYSRNTVMLCYRELKEHKERGEDRGALEWAVRLDALMTIMEKRKSEDRKMMTEQDYRWSLMYVAKDKKYRLTETHLEGSEWVISRTSWDMLSAALSYIDRTNKARQPVRVN